MEDSMEEKVTVRNLFKVFGNNPKRALQLIEDGKTKDEILEMTGLTVGVQDASFGVRSGEIFVVMGLSGSGKSTLVRLLNRLIEPTAGHVEIDGEDVAAMSDAELTEVRRKKMSMVFQSFALLPHLTVLENASFGLEIAGVDKNSRHEKAMEALQQVGLEPYKDSKPSELSGGMQQRVGLARGLAVNPDILLMDEAFSALDPLIRAEMQDLLMDLQSQHQRTIVFISHDLDEAMRIGDRIAIMEGGKVVQVGSPEDILQNPANDYVEAFFRGVDPTNILTAADIARDTQVRLIRHPGDGPRAAMQRMINQDREHAYVVDANQRYLGVVSADSLREYLDREPEGRDITQAFIEGTEPVSSTDSMQDILPQITAHNWPLPVVDEDRRYKGVISKNIFLRTLQRVQPETEG